VIIYYVFDIRVALVFVAEVVADMLATYEGIATIDSILAPGAA
jgi:hypothetical protein